MASRVSAGLFEMLVQGFSYQWLGERLAVVYCTSVESLLRLVCRDEVQTTGISNRRTAAGKEEQGGGSRSALFGCWCMARNVGSFP